MKPSKKIISMLGAFAVLAAAPFSYAATSINANIPSSGDSYEGLVYIDPSIRSSVQMGQTIPFTQTRGFYRTDPYLDPTAIRKEVTWNHQNSSWVNDPGYPTSQVSFGLATALFEDGSGGNGYFYTYNIDRLNTNNGYPLVSKDDISNWVAALGGNQTYIDINLDKSSYMKDPFPGDTWNVASLAQLANESGWYLEPGSATSPTGQPAADVDSGVDTVYSSNMAWPTFKLFPTPAPTTSVTTDKSSYNAGEPVNITATANDYTPNTAYHNEGVYVTGPNGYKKFLSITSGSNRTVPAADESDTQFPYYGVTSATVRSVYGGGSGDPNTPTTYNDTATFPTAGLAQGTYTVHFAMYDNIGRASTSGTNGEVTATFTVGPPKESIKISPPSETVQSGTPVTLSYTVTGMKAGDKVKITPSGNGTEMWSSTGDTNATDSSTEIESSTTNQIGVTYTAVVIDKNGNQVASDTTTIQWSPKKVAPPTNTNGGYGTITDGDIAVGFWDNDWSKVARPNRPSTFTITIKNTNDYSGPVKYTVNVSSKNPAFQPFTKEGVVNVDADSKALIQIPYTPVDWVDPHYGYNIYFQVSIEAIQPKSSDPNDPPPPALQDNVLSNDAATAPVEVPAPPRLSS